MLEEITNNLKEKLVIFFILLEAQKFYMIESLST